MCEWVKCSERLPSYSTKMYVVVNVHGRRVWLADEFLRELDEPGFPKKKPCFRLQSHYLEAITQVTHWMEVPKLPEE